MKTLLVTILILISVKVFAHEVEKPLMRVLYDTSEDVDVTKECKVANHNADCDGNLVCRPYYVIAETGYVSKEGLCMERPKK